MGIAREVRMSSALEQESRFIGDLALAECERLQAEVLIAQSQPALKVQLQVDGRSGWPRLHGDVAGDVKLECQRCGAAFGLQLKVKVDFRLVDAEEDERSLLATTDPYWVRDDRLPLREIVEDEVLLALPMLARCETCENAVLTAPRSPEPKATEERVNPFAALKQQLKTNQE